MWIINEFKKDMLIILGILCGVGAIAYLAEGRLDSVFFQYSIKLLSAALCIGVVMLIHGRIHQDSNGLFIFLAAACNYLTLSAIISSVLWITYGTYLNKTYEYFAFGADLFEAVSIVTAYYYLKRSLGGRRAQLTCFLFFIGALGLIFIFDLFYTAQNLIWLDIIKETAVMLLITAALFLNRGLQEKCDCIVVLKMTLFLCFNGFYHMLCMFFSVFHFSQSDIVLNLLQLICKYYFAAGIFYQYMTLPQQAVAQKLKDTDKMLYENQRDRCSIINLSHELKTPINVIQSAADVIRLDLLQEPDKVLIEGLQEIKSCCYQSTRLITNIIDSHKFDEGFIHPKFKKCNLIAVIQEISTAFKKYNPDYQLIVNVKESALYALIDEELIQKVLINNIALLINSNRKNNRLYINVLFTKDQIKIEIIGKDVCMPLGLLDENNQALENINEWASLEYVKKVLEIHEGTIELVDKEKKGISLSLKTSFYPFNEGTQKESTAEDDMDRLLNLIKIQCADKLAYL